MLKPQLDQAMRAVTQAALPHSSAPPTRAAGTTLSHGSMTAHAQPASQSTKSAVGVVHNVVNLPDLERLLTSASKTCAVIFFTSSTCAPCKIAYPAFDALAEEAGSAGTLIKVDLNVALSIGKKYNVRATPTFMTFLHGEKENEWAGADPSKLLGNVRLLLQMAQHPHKHLNLPVLQSTSQKPVTFINLPPLDKLVAKMNPDIRNDPALLSLKAFVTIRSSEGVKEATLPDMMALTAFLQTSTSTLSPSSLFPVIDLLRVALVDPRFSGYIAEEADHKTILTLLQHVNALPPTDEKSYPLRLVTLQAACNLSTTSLYPSQLAVNPSLSQELISLTTSSLLDSQPSHAPVRVAASSLAFNITVRIHKQRTTSSSDTLSEGLQVELLVSLLEAIAAEEASAAAMKGLLLAIAFLVRETEKSGEVWETAKVMDARGTMSRKGESGGQMMKGVEGLVAEVASLFDKMI